MSRADERASPQSRTTLPPLVHLAARALGVPLDSVGQAGGATNQTWTCGDHMLRTGRAKQLAQEVLAMTAASSAVPVPKVLDRAAFADEEGRECAALLLTRLPGRPVADTAARSLHEARRAGEACGRLHTLIASVEAPEGMRRVPQFSPDQDAPPSEERLLHLDLHPLNVLLDDNGAVSGVVDWANAAIGHPVLDRARTWSLLTLDPAALPFQEEPRFAALLEGWSRLAGWAELPATARAWACEYMLDDLAVRYPAHRLYHVRARLDLERAAR